MAEAHHKTQQITDALTEIRIQVQYEVSRLRRSLDLKQHFLGSIKHHPWQWATSAAIFGWLLSRVPARKKRIYVDSSSQKPTKVRNAGPLGKFWLGFWKFSKPILAAYLAKILAEKANRLKASD